MKHIFMQTNLSEHLKKKKQTNEHGSKFVNNDKVHTDIIPIIFIVI